MKGWMILFLLTTQLLFPSTPIVLTNSTTGVLAQKISKNAESAQINYDKMQRDEFLQHIQQNVKTTLARNHAPYKFPINNSATITTSTNLATKSVSTAFPQLNTIDSNFADDCSYCITKENLFFPKASNADLAFQTTYISGSTMTFDIIRNTDANGNYIDPINRILEVWTDGYLAFSTVVSEDRTISVTGLNSQVVVIRLRWGGYANYAWSIKKLYFSDSNDLTLANNVFFSSVPTTLTQKLTFAFIGGEATELILTAKSLEGNTGSGASLQFYVDGVFYPPSSLYSTNGILTFSGIFPNTWVDRSIHYITIELTSFSGESWYIDSMDISYLALNIYYYWHYGDSIDSSIFDYVENYYKQSGYERVNFISGGQISLFDNNTVITSTILEVLYNTYGHYGQQKTRDLFLVDQVESGLGFGVILNDRTNYYFMPYFAMGVQSLRNIDLCTGYLWFRTCASDNNKIKANLMHELGHTLGILKIHNLAEYYDWGNRDSSVMNLLSYNNAISAPYYSKWYWTGDGKWWENRHGFATSMTYLSNTINRYGVIVSVNEIEV